MLLEVGKGGETGANVADGVRAGGGIGGVDDEVSTLVVGEAIGGETTHFHGDPQTERAEVDEEQRERETLGSIEQRQAGRT